MKQGLAAAGVVVQARTRWVVVLAALLALCARPAQAEVPLPSALRDVGIDGRLGVTVPLDARFVDQDGKGVRLGDYFQAGRPVILTLNYYACATLCSVVLNGALQGMKELAFTPGREYQVVTVSIDPTEKPELARAKRATYLQGLGKAVDGAAWPFLTGAEADIRRVADAVGFRYKYDAATRQYAHVGGLFVLTPDGKLSQILYGVEFRARDLRLALVEASRGGISAPLDKLLLFCYHYDPDERRYLITPMGVMRIGGVLTILLLGTFLLTFWRRERRNSVVHG